MSYPILDSLHAEADFRALPDAVMPELAKELRAFLIEHVQKTGGHLASNLCVVELTLALHKCLDLPNDRLIFDVGHQSYVHKILSGRKDAFDTLRTGEGLSGFTKRSESPYDAFGAGHSSTSLSAALGFAAADALKGEAHYTVCVIGDGAFTGGMIHEALNNCPKKSHLILILNENEMSISRNIGRYALHLAKLRASRGYLRTKNATKSVVERIPLLGKPLFYALRAVKQAVKNLLYRSNYFEEMGIFYLGPADGSDYAQLKRLIEEAKHTGQTTVIHVRTQKGCGYAPAMDAPNTYHGIPPAGEAVLTKTFSTRFGQKLTDMARENPAICAVTAAMGEGTGLSPFCAAHPQRYYDVGIAEEHAMTFCAGLAAAGMRPVFAVYSTFFQRAYDQLLHDVALQKLPVTVVLDRAGLNLHDGATHHGIFDVSLILGIPGVSLYAPVTYAALDAALRTALSADAPCAIRYAHAQESEAIVNAFYANADGASDAALLAPRLDENARQGAPYLIVTYGRIATEALRAKELLLAQGISCGVVLLTDLRQSQPLPPELTEAVCAAKHLLFLEEGIRLGGAGMRFYDHLKQAGLLCDCTWDLLAIDNSFVETMPQGEIYRAAGISAEDAARCLALYRQTERVSSAGTRSSNF